jgi:hypothetical protein
MIRFQYHFLFLRDLRGLRGLVSVLILVTAQPPRGTRGFNQIDGPFLQGIKHHSALIWKSVPKRAGADGFVTSPYYGSPTEHSTRDVRRSFHLFVGGRRCQALPLFVTL